MRKVSFDGAALNNPREIHAALAEKLAFPDWYGRNLDALYDCLGDIFEDTEIVLRHWPEQGFPRRVLQVLTDAAEENRHLRIVLSDEEDQRDTPEEDCADSVIPAIPAELAEEIADMLALEAEEPSDDGENPLVGY